MYTVIGVRVVKSKLRIREGPKEQQIMLIDRNKKKKSKEKMKMMVLWQTKRQASITHKLARRLCSAGEHCLCSWRVMGP